MNTKELQKFPRQDLIIFMDVTYHTEQSMCNYDKIYPHILSYTIVRKDGVGRSCD